MAGYVLEREAGQVLINLSGDLTAVVVPDLHKDLKEALHDAPFSLVFDLSRAEMLDSSGIGLLIAANNSAIQSGKSIRVINVAPEIFRLLQNMRLTARLNVSAKAV